MEYNSPINRRAQHGIYRVLWLTTPKKMNLTGTAQEQFEEWYVDNNYHSDFVDYFEDLHEACKWGVYQDWADSLGEELYLSKEADGRWFWALYDPKSEGYAKSLQDARNAAIESLNGLINQNK
jgi:hypothetical protein